MGRHKYLLLLLFVVVEVVVVAAVAVVALATEQWKLLFLKVISPSKEVKLLFVQNY